MLPVLIISSGLGQTTSSSSPDRRPHPQAATAEKDDASSVAVAHARYSRPLICTKLMTQDVQGAKKRLQKAEVYRIKGGM
jgi:hypothetical protein